MDGLQRDDPRRVGDFHLLARLGAGGMGSVFLGRSPSGRTVAVKFVHAELAGDDGFRRRFRQEVEAARRVAGPWTAPVLDADTDSSTPWVATGYVAGPTLQETVADLHGPLPERTVRALAAGLAGALREVHERDVIHRDLKPSNVMLTLDGPRVIDFGIARATDGSVITRTGAVVGTPGFMPPEQVRGERVGPAGDVFSLGALLAYAATGRQPFDTGEGGAAALLYRVVNEPPDLDGMPEGLRDLAERCLSKDAGERPTPDEIAAAVEAPDASGSWLPAEVVEAVGRRAVELLELERGDDDPPATRPAPPPTPATPPPPGYGAGPPGTPPPGYRTGPQGVPPPGPHPSGTFPAGGPATNPPGPPGPPGVPPGGPGPSGASRPFALGRRSRTVLVMVAVGALSFGLVFGFVVNSMGSDGEGASRAQATIDPAPEPTWNADRAPYETTAPAETAVPTPSQTSPESGGTSAPPPTDDDTAGTVQGDGDVPARFLGTWTWEGEDDDGRVSQRLVVNQGPKNSNIMKVTTTSSDAYCEQAGRLDEVAPHVMEVVVREVRSVGGGLDCSGAERHVFSVREDGALQRGAGYSPRIYRKVGG